MSAIGTLALVLGFVAVGARAGKTAKNLLSADARRARALRREFDSIATKDVGALVEGDIAIVTGTVRQSAGVEPLTAPVSGRDCICYKARVTRLTHRFADQEFAGTQNSESRAAPHFELVDGDRTIAVTATDVRLVQAKYETTKRVRVPSGEPLPAPYKAFLDRVGVGFGVVHPRSRHTTFLFKECALHAGDRVAIAARVVGRPVNADSYGGVMNSYRASARGSELRLVGLDHRGLLIRRA